MNNSTRVCRQNSDSFYRCRINDFGPGFSDMSLYLNAYIVELTSRLSTDAVREILDSDIRTFRELAPSRFASLKSWQLGSYRLSEGFIDYMRSRVNPEFLSN